MPALDQNTLSTAHWLAAQPSTQLVTAMQYGNRWSSTNSKSSIHERPECRRKKHNVTAVQNDKRDACTLGPEFSYDYRWMWGGEDNSTPISQEIPQNVASPTELSLQGFRFSTGEPFDIDSTVLVQGDVLLSFGDFKGTNSAPFTLVAGGFRATGTATWLNIYTLSIQESTFPAASSPQGARGPQVGDQLFIVINAAPLQAQKVNFLNGVRDFTRLKLVGKPINISRRCDTNTGEGDPVDLGTLVPAGSGTSRGCITVNGSINSQEGTLGDTFKLTIQPSDQIVQFILTFPTRTANDNSNVDFDFIIRRTDNPNIPANDNTNILQSCHRSQHPENAGRKRVLSCFSKRISQRVLLCQ